MNRRVAGRYVAKELERMHQVAGLEAVSPAVQIGAHAIIWRAIAAYLETPPS
jgi:hypothetical protein